jgi:hypothetical protein
MVVPIAIALIRVGTQIYKVASNPAVQAAAKELIKKGIAKTTQSTSKKTINLTANRAAKIVSDKTPGVASKIGGKLRGTKVTTATPGAEKGSVVVGAVRTASKKLGDKVIGGTVIGVPSVAAIAKMKADLKKANTETEREKLRADISDAVGKVQEEKAKAKDKSKADTLREDNNTRRGANEKVPEKRVSKDTPGVKKSLRPKLREDKKDGGMIMKKPAAKKMNKGGMPMVMKDGKKVPAYAADGVGKMNMGGMAKKKPAAKKMMAGGMATKKKSTGYMYGGMAKKPKAKK